jgi:hypothetical protein
MSITLGEGHIVQLGLRQKESICSGMRFNRFAGFFESASLRNDGNSENREHRLQNQHCYS